MESFLSRFKNVLVLIVVLVLQLLVLAVQARRPTHDARDREEVGLVRSVVTTVVTPPERVVRATGQWFRGLWFGYLDLVHVRRDNTALKDQIERLQLEQAGLAEDARQGQRLQRLLEFRKSYIYKTVTAQVVGTSGTDQSRVLYIDKGSEDGLEEDMPVVTGDGIVGRVKDVFARSAQVLLISDPTSGVGVILEKTRTRGVLKGTFNGQPQVINVSPDERIQAGDRILTSGGDQIFPRGLPVGTVDRVATDPDRDPLVDVTIHPAANLSRLEEVLVVTDVAPSMSPQTAKDLAASEAEGEAAQKRASDVLSERLPAKIDSSAPADTNPDANATATGPSMKPIPPPKNIHSDQYTPGSVPPATALTPAERLAPLRRGTEEIPNVPKPKPAQNAQAAPGSASSSASAHSSASGSAGQVVRPAGSAAIHAATGTGVTVTVPRSTSAAPATVTPRTTLPPASARPVSGTGTAATGSASRPATSTTPPRTLTGTTGITSGAVHSSTPSSAIPGTSRPATPGSVTTAPRPASGAVSGTPRTAAAGSESAAPRITTPAPRSTDPITGTPSTPAAATPRQAPAGQQRSTAAAIPSQQSKPHVNVVVDGPARSATPKPATPPAAKPAASGATANKSAGGSTRPPVQRPAQGATTTTTAPPARRKGPTLVPDDGSRPPASQRPQPQSSTPPGGN